MYLHHQVEPGLTTVSVSVSYEYHYVNDQKMALESESFVLSFVSKNVAVYKVHGTLKLTSGK